MSASNFSDFFYSRKLFVTGFSMTLVTVVAVAAGVWPAIDGVYPIFVGGITGLAGLYVTSNVSAQWVNNKTGPGPADVPDPPAQPTPEPEK